MIAQTSTIPRTASAAAQALRTGELTSLGLTEAVLELARRRDAELGVFVTRFEQHALARAAAADAELGSGRDRGPLHGIPVGVKDIIATAAGPTTAHSIVHDPDWGAYDAPVVARLHEAGAVIVGKTTTAEFAIGFVDPDRPFPVPRNPWDPGTYTGGSSSGTAGGVAAGMFLVGLGSDTGGSIRMPSAYCGITGLMPTFGRVPKSGVVPLGYSLDRVGPMACSARDCADVLAVIAGGHEGDPDSVATPTLDVPSLDSLAGLRVGVVREHHFPDAADAGLRPAFDAALEVLTGLGADLVETTLPLWEQTVTADVVTLCCEAAAYHRNDLVSRWDDYGRPTRATIAAGAAFSGADYVQAQRVRTAAAHALAARFADVDVLVMPTTATAAPSWAALATKSGRLDLRSTLRTVFTPYWNSVGLPVLAVPIGFGERGLPLSMQLAGPAFAEARLLGVGEAYQSETDWHLRLPADPSAPGTPPNPPPLQIRPDGVVASADEQQQVASALRAYGVSVDPAELASTTVGWASARAAADAMYALDRDTSPALRFRAG